VIAIAGRATAEGTQRYKQRHNQNCAADYFREANSLVGSSIGIGTYLGEPDECTDTLVMAAVIESVQQGANLIDSAINYQYQHGELSVGKALRQLVALGDVSRDELIICTKGGVLPRPNPNHADWFYRHYIEPNNSTISRADFWLKSVTASTQNTFRISLTKASLISVFRQSMFTIFTILKSNLPKLRLIFFTISCEQFLS